MEEQDREQAADEIMAHWEIELPEGLSKRDHAVLLAHADRLEEQQEWWGSFASLVELAEATGLDQDEIVRAHKSLQEEGFIERHRNHGAKSRRCYTRLKWAESPAIKERMRRLLISSGNNEYGGYRREQRQASWREAAEKFRRLNPNYEEKKRKQDKRIAESGPGEFACRDEEFERAGRLKRPRDAGLFEDSPRRGQRETERLRFRNDSGAVFSVPVHLIKTLVRTTRDSVWSDGGEFVKIVTVDGESRSLFFKDARNADLVYETAVELMERSRSRRVLTHSVRIHNYIDIDEI